MNREDIIRMGRQAGAELAELPRGDAWLFTDDECLERFAALVASAEREACIVDIQWRIPRSGRQTPEYQMAMRMLERIRARGDKHD